MNIHRSIYNMYINRGIFMEYTRDVIFKVNYGQAEEKNKVKLIVKNIIELCGKHKMITTIVAITMMLIAIDLTLVASFVKILSKI